MSYRGLKVAVGLVLALSYGAAYGASPPDLILVQEPIASIAWGRVNSLAFSPDGKCLVAAGTPSQWLTREAANPAGRKGGAVACWTVADWKPIAAPRLDIFSKKILDDTDDEILVWTPDSTRLTIYDSRFNRTDHKTFTKIGFSVWNRDGWGLLSTSETNTAGPCLAISPDGASYVAHKGIDGINVWDLRMGSLRYSINVIVDPKETSHERFASKDSAAYSSNGKWLAVSYGDLVCLINDATRAVVSRRRMLDTVRRVLFQPNTQNLLVVCRESYQLLAAPDLTPVLPPVTSDNSAPVDVQFSTDGKWFAAASLVSSSKVPDMRSIMTVITLVETATMKVFGTIGPLKGQGEKLTLSQDGSKIVLATFGIKYYTGSDSMLLVFPTSKPGGPSPDAWLKAHGGSATPAADQPALSPKDPPDTLGH